VEVATFGKILGPFSPIVPLSAAGVRSRRFRCGGTPGGGSWNVLIIGPPSWWFDVPLATALCKNRHAENYSTVVDQVKTPKGCSVD